MGYVGAMVYGYPIPSDVVKTIKKEEAEVLKGLEGKAIYIYSYGEESCSWTFDTDEPIIGVWLDEQTTQRIIEEKRKMLKLNVDLQALLDKYKIKKVLYIRAYGHHS